MKLLRYRIHYYCTSPEKYNSSGFYSAGASYNSRKIYSTIYLFQMDRNYIADVGFTPRLYNYDSERDTSFRLGYKEVFARQLFKFYPKQSFINQYRFGGMTRLFYNTNNDLTEYELIADGFIQFQDRSWIYARYYFSMIDLPFPTEIIDSDNSLPAQRYNYNGFFARYKTSRNNRLSGTVYGGYGSFYNGTNLTLGSAIYFRTQPWGNFSIDYQLNKVKLAEDYGEQDLHLLGAKSEISFSRKLFWTTFLQYNTQAENFNINSRIQWRYKSMSDIYFVVTNNYYTTNFSQKDLMFVLKLSYWFNV